MSNELIFLGKVVVDLAVVFIAYRLGKPWLFMAMGINLILISAVGAELVTVFGFVTNTGNVFYAIVFLIVQLLTEHYGKATAKQAIWVSATGLVLFLLMFELTLNKAAFTGSVSYDTDLQSYFAHVPRIAFASLLPFIIVQHLNISLFSYFARLTAGKMLWLRANISNVVGQALDSVLFFSIAFMQTIPDATLWQSILVGFILKIFVGLIGTLVLYLSAHYKRQEA